MSSSCSKFGRCPLLILAVAGCREPSDEWWRPRSLGERKSGLVAEEGRRPDGEGNLEATLTRVGDRHPIAQVSTQEAFLQPDEILFDYVRVHATSAELVSRESGSD